MSRTPATLLVAAATTAVLGLLDQQGWPSFVIGAVLALCLWVMLFFGTFGAEPPYRVGVRAYAAASALSVVIGGVMVWMTEQSAFWAVGFIVAGVLWPAGRIATRDRAEV